jgi:hypothetical protein
MIQAIAIHCIYRPHPEGPRFMATGSYDANGEAVLRAVSQILEPGTPFETDEVTFRELRANGAARLADEDELQLRTWPGVGAAL